MPYLLRSDFNNGKESCASRPERELDSALGSHPCVALSSFQAPHTERQRLHNWFHPVNIPTRPSPNTMRIFS